MDIRDLMYLEASAAAGNFARAAKSLGLTTSTISRSVGRLEDELGLALFERGHGGVRITAGGKARLAAHPARTSRTRCDQTCRRQNGSGIVGEVRLAVRMPPIGEPLRSLLLGWREEYPKCRADCRGDERVGVLTAIQERRLDVALIASHALWPDAVAAPLYHERLVAALPREHPLAKKRRSIGRACARKPSWFRAGTTVSPPASSMHRSWAVA